MKRLFLLLGFLFFGLGAVGAFLPILPTVPFLLLASVCFSKGSQKYHDWFIKTKLHRKYLKPFLDTRALTLKGKLLILLPVSAMLIVSMIAVNHIAMWIGVGTLMLFKYYYFIFRIRTIPKAEKLEMGSKMEQGKQIN